LRAREVAEMQLDISNQAKRAMEADTSRLQAELTQSWSQASGRACACCNCLCTARPQASQEPDLVLVNGACLAWMLFGLTSHIMQTTNPSLT